MYELKTEKFSGPLETLLELIEGKKLEITELSLADVTADFLTYLEKIEETHPRLLADFVVVASKLLLIKSKALLPNLALTTEEEKDIKDLETQLRFYQNFKPAIVNLEKFWEGGRVSISRPLMAGRPVIFYPSANVNAENLLRVIGVIFEAINRFQIETQTIKSPLITLEEKIREIINLFESKATMLKFKELRREKPRAEIIVMFLALLHLIHERLLKADQSKQFADIIIKKS